MLSDGFARTNRVLITRHLDEYLVKSKNAEQPVDPARKPNQNERQVSYCFLELEQDSQGLLKEKRGRKNEPKPNPGWRAFSWYFFE